MASPDEFPSISTLIQSFPSTTPGTPRLTHSHSDDTDDVSSDSDLAAVHQGVEISMSRPRTVRRQRPPEIIIPPPSVSQKQSYRRSTNHSSLQAARLAIQIKELQLQQQEVLRSSGIKFPMPPPSPAFASGVATVDGRLSVPPSPGFPQTPRTTTSGPPPLSPLPPIPRAAVERSAPSTPVIPKQPELFNSNASNGAEVQSNGTSRTYTSRSSRRIDASSLILEQHGMLILRQNSEQGNLVADYAHPATVPNSTAPVTSPPMLLSQQQQVSQDESAPGPRDYENFEDELMETLPQRDSEGRSNVRHADLSTWASWPNNHTTLQSNIPNLPDWEEIEDGAPSSIPNRQIQRDMDYSMRRLLNPQVFESLLQDPLGRRRFRDFLVSSGASTAEVDLWFDLSHHARLMEELQTNAEAIQDVYLTPGSQYRVKLPPNVFREIDSVVRRKTARPDIAFTDTQQHLLENLYHGQFQNFVKHKIIEQAEIKLGKHNLTNSDGLGDCFCLTNPRLRDHPIVLVSDGFNAVTGYPRSQIVGRNCRFLQGPGTSPEAIQRIRDALNNGEAFNELLLNYRRDGSPFYCLLCIIPLRDSNGELVYFIGGQTNVTGVLTESKNLAFLISGNLNQNIPFGGDEVPKFSPAMAEYMDALSPNGANVSQSDSSRKSGSMRGTGAAGEINNFNPLSNEFGLSSLNVSSSPMGTKLGGMIGRLFNNKKSTESDMLSSHSNLMPGTGTEAVFGATAKSSQAQILTTRNVYQKLIIFKKTKREVIFVTQDLLAYLGLPCSSYRDLYSSPLVHSDLLDCITSGDKASTKILRGKIKNAIKADESMSVEVGLKISPGWGMFPGRSEHTLRTGILHMTPLKERDGQCVAYVCVFG